MRRLFSSMTGMILTALGLDRQAVRALEIRRDVMPPAPDFQHPQSGSKAYRRIRGSACGCTQYAEGGGKRHERRQTGISARQQHIKKRNSQGHTKNVARRKYDGIITREPNVRQGRAATRFMNRFMVGYGPGVDKRQALSITSI